MDKKVMYGLGAVALIGAILYFRNKSSVAPAEEVAEEPAEEGAGGGGAGGGGGASAPSPTDMAMGEVAKEELRKSMDLGGLDMASPKAEKGAVATGMVASMVASGKPISPTMGRAVLGAKLPPATKNQIVDKVVKSTPSSRTTESPLTAIFGKKESMTTKPKPLAQVGKVISKGANAYVDANKKLLTNVYVKPAQQVGKVVSKGATAYVDANKKLLTNVYVKPAQQVSKAVSKAVAKPVAKITAKFKKFDGNYGFDGEDMFANAVSTNKQCHYENEIVGYSSTGQPIVQQKLVCVSNNTAKFDGDYDMSNFSGASDF